jgi:hypothetical protein
MVRKPATSSQTAGSEPNLLNHYLDSSSPPNADPASGRHVDLIMRGITTRRPGEKRARAGAMANAVLRF